MDAIKEMLLSLIHIWAGYSFLPELSEVGIHMITIGLTGNMGSGKSTAAAYLAQLGAAVIDAEDVYKRQAMGINKIIYTDLRRYGSMKGPNFQGIEEMVETSGMEIVVAGGISDYQALRRLKDIGVAGAVIGKAIYSGNIELPRALEIAAS